MEEKKPEEAKKPAEEKKAEEKPAEEKKTEEKKAEDGKEEKAQAPPPPQEIVLKVYMHCEGCARKVRRCLKGFEGLCFVSFANCTENVCQLVHSGSVFVLLVFSFLFFF